VVEFLPHPCEGKGIVMSVLSVCLSVCLSAAGWLESRKPLVQTQPNFFVHVTCGAVARWSSDSVAIHYVLPVLWMTSCYRTVGPVAACSYRSSRSLQRRARANVLMHGVGRVLTWTTTGAKTRRALHAKGVGTKVAMQYYLAVLLLTK